MWEEEQQRITTEQAIFKEQVRRKFVRKMFEKFEKLRKMSENFENVPKI